MKTLQTINTTKGRKNWLLAGILSAIFGAVILLLFLTPNFVHHININGYFGEGQVIGLIIVFVIPDTLIHFVVNLTVTAIFFSFFPPISQRLSIIVALVGAIGIALIDSLYFYGYIEIFKLDYFWLFVGSLFFMMELLLSAIVASKTQKLEQSKTS